MSDTPFLDHQAILEILPHRFPFLLVDRVLEMELGKRAVGIKQVSFGEPYFTGHFPSDPVMPGVLQIECLAQMACILIFKSFPETNGKRPAFLGIDKARFRKAVRPGDSLRLEVELTSWRRGMGNCQGRILVDGAVVCEAEILATLI
jgi:3-hydroxyacyl-[acyl-carrier-protein] dehydratase